MSPTFTAATTAEEVAAAFADQIRGKNVLITGTTKNGLGFATARAIAKDAGLVILTGRSTKKLQESADALKAEFPTANIRQLVLDLSSRASIRKAAAEVNAYPEAALDVLVNNAMPDMGPLVLTEDKLESQFAITHVAHFHLAKLLAPKLLASTAPRVVVVSSAAQAMGAIDWETLKPGSDQSKYNAAGAYAQSKVASMLFARELTKRSGGRLSAYSVNPGMIDTSASEHPETLKTLQALGMYDPEGKPNPALPWKTRSQGSATTVVAAFDPTLAGKGGSYLSDCVLADDQMNPIILDESNASRMWEVTEEILGEKFTF